MTNLNPIVNASNGIVNLTATQTPWELAVDCVDYPVHFLPLYINKANVDGQGETEFIPAAGTTNTGRNTEFFGVVVDKLRDGKLETISTVTGTYATLPTAQVYREYQVDLDVLGVDAQPKFVYVSGSGGSHALRVAINGLETPLLSGQKFTLNLDLLTSVDGSKKHQLVLAPVDEKGVALIGVAESIFNVAAKHTKSIMDRHLAFGVIINKMIAEWNDLIAPTLMMMDGEKVDRGTAIEIVESILDAADIPERHIKAAVGVVSASSQQSVLTILSGMSDYFHDACDDKPERMAQFKAKINKVAEKEIKKFLNK